MRTKNCCIPIIFIFLRMRFPSGAHPQVFFEIYGDVGFATYNFRLRFYCPLYLLPISYDDSPHRWLVYVKVSITSVVLLYLSEFRLIQPQDGISVLPLPITRSKELLLYLFSKSTFSNYYRRVFSTFSRIPTHHKSWSGLPYGLLKDTHCSVNPIRS